jgi:hypothetical protein
LQLANWIPKNLHDMIETFEDEIITVTLSKRNTKVTKGKDGKF